MNKKIYVIHENNDWTQHLTRRLDELSAPYETWHLDSGHFDLSAPPPDGVYYNRMSASSHTRGHRFAPELTGAVLDWLEFHNRRVLNGSDALRLELSKVKQYAALERAGIHTPRTVFAVGREQIVTAASELGNAPFITKHNRAGKGLGVHKFESIDDLEAYVKGPQFDESVDGITLVQEYIDSPGGFITRAEFVGGKYLYSVRVRTDDSFQLCPADNCQIELANPQIRNTNYLGTPIFAACPADNQPMKFEIIATPETVTGKYRDIVTKYEQFLAKNKIDVAGIEFIEDASGNIYTYDVNTNTNYNKDAEEKVNKFAMLELAKLLKSELAQESGE